MGWVFQGSPNRFDLDDYLSRHPELIYWRTPRYETDIEVGDRAFIWRAGPESGAVAIGTVVEAATRAGQVLHAEALGNDLWVEDEPDADEFKTGIRIDELRLTTAQNMVARARVIADPVLAQTQLICAPRGTVFKLTSVQTESLERLWFAKRS